MDFTDGIVMLITSSILAVVLVIIIAALTKKFKQPKWAMLIPMLICLIVMLSSLFMLLMPNGTGGYTQLEYLGVFMYSMWTCIFSSGIVSILFLVKIVVKFINND